MIKFPNVLDVDMSVQPDASSQSAASSEGALTISCLRFLEQLFAEYIYLVAYPLPVLSSNVSVKPIPVRFLQLVVRE